MRLQNTVFLVLVMALFWTCPAGAAAAVGRLAQVEGSVDILKEGQLPAVPAKLEDQIETGDVLRTKSAARAQVRFLDDSVLTIAPGSLVAVDDYFYDRAQNRRRAALNVLRGLVHCLVVRLFQVQEPDFLVKTLRTAWNGQIDMAAPAFPAGRCRHSAMPLAPLHKPGINTLHACHLMSILQELGLEHGAAAQGGMEGVGSKAQQQDNPGESDSRIPGGKLQSHRE